jgi:hypothetical protein
METEVVSQKETQMRGMFFRGAVGALMVLAVTRVASAQVLVQLPDSSQTTTLTATVSDQATVTTPANVTFTVNDVASSTAGSAAAVTVTGIVLPTATDKLKISVKAAAASFTPPVALATTWDASDVSWTGGTWTNATAASGTLSSASFGEIAPRDAAVPASNRSAVAFTLAAKPSVRSSGNHTLTITCKFEKL